MAGKGNTIITAEKENLLPNSKVNFNVYIKSDLGVELYIGPDQGNNLSNIVPKDVRDAQSAIAIHK